MTPNEPRHKPPNVLHGLSPSLHAAMVLTGFDLERAERMDRTLLMDVVIRGARALTAERRGNRKGRK